MSALPDRIVVPGWPAVFRGSLAVRGRARHAGRLRGPGFERLAPDVHAPVGDEAPDLTLRSLGAYVFANGRGVLCGYSAAELLGASCAPLREPAHLMVPGGGVHPCSGVIIHRDALARDERTIGRFGARCTDHRRTAYELARWSDDLVEGVVAVDRLVLHGLPRTEVQWVVQDERRRRAVWLDLAYPDRKIGIEYEGEDHVRPERVLRDIGRGTDLLDQGWRIYRFAKHDMSDPAEMAAKIDRALPVR